MPLEDGDYNGFLTIVSNDVDESEVVIPISGSSIAPPIVGVSPSSLSSALFTGETETQSLIISNTGGSELTFSVNVVNNSNTRCVTALAAGLASCAHLWPGASMMV